MNSNTTIQELPIANLTALLNDKLVKCLVLRGQRMDESEISMHAGFLTTYFKKSCLKWKIYDMSDFFLKLMLGDIVKTYKISSVGIIEAIKIYKNKDRVMGTQFDDTHMEYAHSQENKNMVKHSLKTGLINKKALYSYSEYSQLDPEFKARYEELKTDDKFKSYR